MIDQSILLQGDATVIAGVLILLTITRFRDEPQISIRPPLPYGYAAAIILPFACSAIFIIVLNSFSDYISFTDKLVPLLLTAGMTIIGFLYLIVFLSSLAFKRRSTGL